MTIEGLLALRGQPPQVEAAEAEAVALEVYGLEARAQPLPGERDRNFRLEVPDGRRLVLKFLDHEADGVIVAGQAAVLRHLAERNPPLAVPRIIATREGEELGLARTGATISRVRLMTYLPGRPILAGTPAAVDGKLCQSIGRQIGQLDRALAGFFHPALGQPIAWDIRQLPTLMPLMDHIRLPAARRLVDAALPRVAGLLRDLRGLRSQAIHGDCHARNLLIDDSGECVGIIDLGDMIHAPLALEIAVAMAEFLADGIVAVDALGEILWAYTREQPLESGDVGLLYELVSARIGVEVLIHVWRERHRPEIDSGAKLPEMLAQALEQLEARGRERLTAQWHEAAGVAEARAPGAPRVPGPGASRVPGPGAPRVPGPGAPRVPEPGAPRPNSPTPGAPAVSRAPAPPSDLLRRRHNTLGANAELSYERPLHLVRGEGVWVFAADGERLLDVYNNVPHVGHAHPVVAAAIADQAKRIASNTRYLDERIIEYVERLTATLPPDLNTCLFVNSGSEANDIAWRMARAHTGNAGALVMTFAYHGITEAATALSPAIRGDIPAYVEQLAAPNSADAQADVDRAIANLSGRGLRPAALILDSALTSTGIHDPPPTWIAPIAAAVREAGGLIVGDEVQYGLGRSGSDFWGFVRRGYHPDIVTLGKPVGNGYPLGVVITRRELLERFQKQTGFFSTFGGNPVAAAAGLAVLDVLQQERLLENARTTGDYFMNRLRQLQERFASVAAVRGSGLLIGVEVTDRSLTRRVVNGMRDRGVLIGSEGPRGNVLKLRPPMPFRREHADLAVAALEAALSADGALRSRSGGTSSGP